MKLPPKEKILEAYSAIADKRLHVMDDHHAECTSSDGSKTYHIAFDKDTYASDDNATYWQGYPGYPVLAVLLKQGRLTLDEKLIQNMKHIPWKKLNDQFKRNYHEAAEYALKDIPEKEEIQKMADQNNQELSELNLTIKRKLKIQQG